MTVARVAKPAHHTKCWGLCPKAIDRITKLQTMRACASKHRAQWLTCHAHRRVDGDAMRLAAEIEKGVGHVE